MEHRENGQGVAKVEADAIRPQSVPFPDVWALFKEGVTKSFRLWRFFLWNVLSVLLAAAFSYLVYTQILPIDADGNFYDLTTGKYVIPFAVGALLFAVILFFMVKVYVVSMYAITSNENENNSSFIDAWKASARTTWSFIGLGFLLFFIWYGTVWLLLIPAIVVSIFTWLAIPHILHSQDSAFASLLYSTHITQKNWWAVFGRVVAIDILLFLILPLSLLVVVLVGTVALTFVEALLGVVGSGGSIPQSSIDVSMLISLVFTGVIVFWVLFVTSFHVRGRLYWKLKEAQPPLVADSYKKTKILYIAAALLGVLIFFVWEGFVDIDITGKVQLQMREINAEYGLDEIRRETSVQEMEKGNL